MKTAKTKAYRIRRYEFSHPGATAKEIAKAVGASEAYVYVVQYNDRKRLKQEAAQAKEEAAHVRAAWKTVAVTSSSEPLPVTMEEPAPDLVNHPAHYKVGGIETIDFIEAKQLNYNMGNAVKYIARADHKGNRKQDLEKAVWYLTREINSIREV